MRYMLGLFLVAGWLFGLILFFRGIRGLWTTWRRWASLRSAVGEVIGVEEETVQSDEYDVEYPVYTPVLRFKTASGEAKTFRPKWSFGPSAVRYKTAHGQFEASRSAFGSRRSSPYKVGMTVPVLYDPDGVIPPMIDSWTTIWGASVGGLFGGLVLLGIAAFASYYVFLLYVLDGRI